VHEPDGIDKVSQKYSNKQPVEVVLVKASPIRSELAPTAPCGDIAPPVIDGIWEDACKEGLRRKVRDTVKRPFD
jgi:hypothetical protein